MRVRALSRYFPLLLACLLTACVGTEPEQTNYPPLDFSYLPALPLNVASVEVQTAYVPSGQPPDVSQYDPVSPVAMLRRMAEERLTAAGTSGRAVFVIDDASMTRSGDSIIGVMSVTLNIYTSAGQRAGFAQATVTRQTAGAGENLQATLYGLTRDLMQQMNIEFEYRVRRSLHAWLLSTGAPTPVQQAPLEAAPPTSGTVPAVPPLPYAPPPAGSLPEPVSGAPPAVPALPSPAAPAAPLAPPMTAPPPPAPALPAPLAPAAPLPQPAPLPPPGPVID